MLYRWQVLCERLGAKGNMTSVYRMLTAYYDDLSRSYHTLEHIRHCLMEFDSCESYFSPMIERDKVEMALWFHDVIYDPKRKDNEELSATYARIILKEYGMEAIIPDVERLIMATTHTYLPEMLDEQVICDIDLAILGSHIEEFEGYEDAIRKEYSWVPAENYTLGRRNVLNSFLERRSVFSTWFFHGLYEARARKNIERTIGRL